MKALIKNLAYRILPQGLLTRAKRFHYQRTFKSFPVEMLPEFGTIPRLIPAGSTVLDIGANIGLFSKCFSLLVGAKGRVYSLGPVLETYNILCSNIKHLGIENVTPLNYAASNSETTATMVIPTYRSRHGVDGQGAVYEGEGNNFYEARITSNENAGTETGAKYITVDTKRIDTLFANIAGKISFIKCDVEGHELACILGGLKIIRRDYPALLIEVMGDPNLVTTEAFQLFTVLEQEGYTPFILKNSSLIRYDRSNDDVNFFFLRPNHI